MKKILLFFISFCFALSSFPETIKLKNGKIIEGKIIERKKDYLKIEVEGIPITYHYNEITNEITSLNGNFSSPPLKINYNKINLSKNTKEGKTSREIAKEIIDKRIKLEYSQQSNPDQSIADYTKAIEADPSYARAYSGRGASYYFKGNYDQAIADCTKAISLDPGYYPSYYNRGYAYENKGDYDKAILDYAKVIELKPALYPAYFSRANVYFKKGDYGKAWEDVHKIESLGGEISPSFIRELKEASGREK